MNSRHGGYDPAWMDQTEKELEAMADDLTREIQGWKKRHEL